MSQRVEKVVAMILAAGAGKRMNAGINKVWLLLDGQPLFGHTLEVFLKSSLIHRVLLVVNPDELPQFERYLADHCQSTQVPVDLVAGGAERQDSVANGLQYLRSKFSDKAGYQLVAVHDAARALLTADLLATAVAAGQEYRAAALGVPVKDTIKQVGADGLVVATPERAALWMVQTPQVFDLDLLDQCYRKATAGGLRFTDDCGVVEYFGHPVKLVRGSYENLKITTPEDLLVAEAILRRRKHADWTGV